MQQPLTFLLMIPYIMTFFFVRNPDHIVAVVMSMLPPFAPMIMFTRLMVGSVPVWQVALSLTLLIGSTWLVFRGAAKIFRQDRSHITERTQLPYDVQRKSFRIVPFPDMRPDFSIRKVAHGLAQFDLFLRECKVHSANSNAPDELQ